MDHKVLSPEVNNAQASAALKEVTDIATRVLGSRDLAAHWLAQPALALDGQRPQDLLATVPGLAEVKTLLARMEFGVYT